MRDLVPSWKVIMVSTCTDGVSPYSASMMSAYFSLMTPRRTLRVRVSSPSSASSSL